MKSKLQAKRQPAAKAATLDNFFKLIDAVAKKAKTDPSSQKIIDSAAQKWQSYNGGYHI